MRQWVLLAYRLPREPSSPRIALWRQLRRLGAAQIGDGLVALPLDPETREQLEWLASGVEESGGEASVWIAEPTTRQQEERWMTRMTDSVSREYERLAVRAREAAGSGPIEVGRSLRLLRAELRRVRGRDHFASPTGPEAAAAIEALAGRGTAVIR